MIQMKYPYKAGDSRYDGTIHKIEPFDLKRKTINGRDLYVMRYKDLTLKNNDMITILEKRGAVFYKVPLESYGTEFRDFVLDFYRSAENVDVSALPGYILVSPITNIRKATAPLTATAVMKLVYYNTADGHYYWEPGCALSSLIEGAPESLGKKVGDTIVSPMRSGTGITYKIKNVRVERLKLEPKKDDTTRTTAVAPSPVPPTPPGPVPPTPPKDTTTRTPTPPGPVPPTPPKDTTTRTPTPAPAPAPKTKETKTIYLNLYDSRYYSDEKCKNLIVGAPKSLGNIVGTKIIGFGSTNYQIKTVFKATKYDRATPEDINTTEQKKDLYYDEKTDKYYLSSKNEIGDRAVHVIRTIDYLYEGHFMRNKFYSIEKDTLIKLFGEDFKNKFNIVNIEVRKLYDSTSKKDMIADMMDDSKKDDDTKTSGPVIKK